MGPELQTLSQLIKNIEIAMLTTVDEGQYVRSRPMATHELGEDGLLWFFTSAASGNVHDVETRPQVNVAYADPGRQRYVSVSGRARLSRDRGKMRELWKPAYRVWFREGLDDPLVALLAVEVEMAEYWDPTASAMVHVAGFDAAQHARLEPARRI